MKIWMIFAEVITNPFPKVPADGNAVTRILQLVFGIATAMSVLMVALGGFTYTRSQGEPQKIAEARNTIIYSAIGLVVSISAFTIVSFILGRLD